MLVTTKSDVLSLILAWGASLLSRRQPSPRYTYGLRRSSILIALLNAILLLLAMGGITWETLQRFSHPEPVAGGTVISVAAVGIVINTITWYCSSPRLAHLGNEYDSNSSHCPPSHAWRSPR